ncbi:hypothetical protein GS397_15060 [Sphingobium yanoikuyae]|uniref:Uncharacterized protein n=1 Tax=Sphingobium yanoikuyae TaxID=13690 RepID=A0A6P1GJM0_SPHYA|nr:hypothetical protein [Sphingobium yanoikuyae]QHD68232.1 hypothetical protein GS397_15060 [Sphingobium yanoikuyae]
MTEDVRAALERFQQFTGRFSTDNWIIDQESGFTFGDAMILVGEVERAPFDSIEDESPID